MAKRLLYWAESYRLLRKQDIEKLRASKKSMQELTHMDHHLPDDSMLKAVILHHFHR
jgi:hypothetical protein